MVKTKEEEKELGSQFCYTDTLFNQMSPALSVLIAGGGDKQHIHIKCDS